MFTAVGGAEPKSIERINTKMSPITKLLAGTILTYYLPDLFTAPGGVFFFLFMTAWSLMFIAWLDTQIGNIATALIGVELFGIALNFVAGLCYLTSLKSIYIYEHRPSIICACFIAELLIIGARTLYVIGVDASIYNLRHAYDDVSTLSRSSVRVRPEGIQCTTQT